MMKFLNLPAQGICDKYISGRSPIKIGKDYNVSETTIVNVLKHQNIKMRTMSEAHQKFKSGSVIICRKCNTALTDDNWCKSNQEPHRNHICDTCFREQKKQEIYKRGDSKPMSENKDCSSYLGVVISETILSHIFNDVERMPYGNHGFDFICNKGKKIDVKSRCYNVKREERHSNSWTFHSKKNVIADYFLCLGFDNRENLNPKHIWLIPNNEVKESIHISESKLDKWSKYEISLDKVLDCCNTMKGGI